MRASVGSTEASGKSPRRSMLSETLVTSDSCPAPRLRGRSGPTLTRSEYGSGDRRAGPTRHRPHGRQPGEWGSDDPRFASGAPKRGRSEIARPTGGCRSSRPVGSAGRVRRGTGPAGPGGIRRRSLFTTPPDRGDRRPRPAGLASRLRRGPKRGRSGPPVPSGRNRPPTARPRPIADSPPAPAPSTRHNPYDLARLVRKIFPAHSIPREPRVP